MVSYSAASWAIEPQRSCSAVIVSCAGSSAPMIGLVVLFGVALILRAAGPVAAFLTGTPQPAGDPASGVGVLFRPGDPGSALDADGLNPVVYWIVAGLLLAGLVTDGLWAWLRLRRHTHRIEAEVSGLQVGDVDFGKNLVVIRLQVFPGKGGLVTKPTKSREERRVPILEPLRSVLERLTNGKQPEDSLLFGPKGGYLTTATVRDAMNWDGTVAKLGLPDLTRHGLRHTWATWMADAGIPLHVIQDILGHASMETTRGYLHPDDRHLASAAEQANAFLSAAGQRKHARRSGPTARGL